MLAKVLSAAILGVDVKTVDIEVNPLHQGQTTTVIVVGLPDAAVRESRERVWSAIKESSYSPPSGKTTISLAPADLRKVGSAYDLPIALATIAAEGVYPREALDDVLVVGELALDGSVRPIRGALPIAMHATKLKMRMLILPELNALEAAAANGVPVIGVKSLRDTVDFLTGRLCIPRAIAKPSDIYRDLYEGIPDFIDVKGQESAKRALTIAAAGNHNILMVGPPGTGKSMLAKRVPGIMPPLSMEESLEVTKIHSIAGVLEKDSGLIVRRPFRNPHHTVSDAGLVGGQALPRPGELSLAHNGVLFLDELPEFRRNVLEVMRQPLENGEVTLSRATGSFLFPARFMLIAAMNPCPCGYYGSRVRRCKCTPLQIAAYRGRISGPLLDRIDMHIEIAQIDDKILTSKRNGESSKSMRNKVLAARIIQAKRYKGTGIRDNSGLSGQIMDEICRLTPECSTMLRAIIKELQLSARAYDRIVRVARTIADLDGGRDINAMDISEAASYRVLDRQQW